ncbi:MAG: flotillin, partial [Massilia sp.]|nr:flotillin [Massilia sp.]
MDGTLFGRIIAAVIIVVLLAYIAIKLLSWLYLRSSKDHAFIRTGMGGEKVVLDGGALVLPVVHNIVNVNMNTVRIEVKRGQDRALVTRDRMRVDAIVEFHVRVASSAAAVSAAAQAFGSRMGEPERLKEMIEGRLVDALRSAAAAMSIEELHERRSEFVRSVREAVAGDLLKNGLELEAVSLTHLEQSSTEFFNPGNQFDAEGLTRLTQQIEQRRKERNDIEQDSMVSIRRKNIEVEKLSLALEQESALARLAQEKALDMARGAQRA